MLTRPEWKVGDEASFGPQVVLITELSGGWAWWTSGRLSGRAYTGQLRPLASA